MYPTRLFTKPIGSAMSAAEHLGVKDVRDRVQYVPVVFQPSRAPCSCWIIIPKGFKALVNSNGKHVGTWDAGFYCAPPWMNISHLVPLQHIVYDTPIKECPTQDNVMVTIDVALVLNIIDQEEALLTFCYKLGPAGLDQMLRALQEEAIRSMARNRKYNEIYDLMDTKQDKQLDGTMRDLNAHFVKFGVNISNIAITNVHLPNEFAQTMQEATIWHNRNEYNTLEQNYKLKVIETREAETKEKQKTKEDLEKFQADRDKEVAESRKKNEVVKAETSKVLADIRETEKADVLQIDSESQLEVAKIDAKKDVELAKIKSEGQAEHDAIHIESETYVKTKLAAAQTTIAANNAAALQQQASAEKIAAEQLKAKRDYEQRMRSLQTLRAIAQNPNISITGNNSDNVLAQLVANQRHGAVLGINAPPQ